MRIKTTLTLAVLTLLTASAHFTAHAGSDAAAAADQHIAGDRTVLGVVEEIRSDQARIGTHLGQPRFVPMNVRKEKGLPVFKKGDLVEMTVNDQNLLVNVYLAGESNHHRVVMGQLAQPVDTGHQQAVIRTTEGVEESHDVRASVQSKVASIPVGADVIFLLDETEKIVDVTFGSTEAIRHSTGME